ncbi:glycosyl hydrolase family 18 protein [Enterobacter sp. CC120223-11]|uniref:glycosyl hydrolase family 18 protein n=1 Tax=Enterobacter sp. CC120223-11 TaxID=1378073 RepID=UPI000BDCDF26|nr:glycosyl hydrolase family 18 protein [Enterobacter sp. CC120223-11]SNY65772.1 chitinase [Enterobacter sp. CC120223-11]
MLKKKNRRLNAIALSLMLGGMLTSQLSHAAFQDAASEMPDISQKKILVGYWHNWGINPEEIDEARGYQGGLPSDMSLREVPKGFNVVNVAFMKVMKGQTDNIPTFRPYNTSDEAFRAEVAELNAQGRAVLISLGGAQAHIELRAGQEQALANEIIRLVETYGFDGLDIDLEQDAIAAANNSTVIPAALKIVRAHYQQQGKHFIISMAPEFPYLQANRGVNYKAYLQNLAGVYDFIAPQYYNQAGDGVNIDKPEEVAEVGAWWLPQEAEGGTSARHKELFLYYLTDSLANGSRGYVQIPANKLVIGLPANADAAGSGYVKDAQSLYNAMARLAANNEPVKGLMTWSINWDNGTTKSGQHYGYEFLSRYQDLLEGNVPDDKEDTQAPTQVQGLKAVYSEGRVNLEWQPASDNVGVAGYTVWRDLTQVGETANTGWQDKGLKPGETYRYTVIAYDEANNFATPSQPVLVTIPATDDEEEEEVPDQIGAFTEGKVYEVGDKVQYDGKVYRCTYAHTAASHWAPDRAVNLWAAE